MSHLSTSILSIPNDLKFEIFSHLPEKNCACELTQICKELLELLKHPRSDERLWKKKSVDLMRKDKAEKFFIEFGNWKFAYFNFKKMMKLGFVVSPTEIETSKGKFRGQFRNGQLNGWGILKCSNGKVTVGEFSQSLELNGEGRITIPDTPVFYVTIYEGEFQNGVLIQGSMIFPGKIKSGKFNRNGWLEGQGVIIHCDGKKEEGEFKYNELVKGKKTYPDGSIEEGTFRKGKLTR